MRQYEVAILLHPDLEIDIESATSKIEKILTANGGKIVKKDNWGKRKLAYKIKKQEWGIYVFYTVELPTEAPQKITNTLRITEEVMRYLVVSLERIRYVNKPTEGAKKEAPKDKTEKAAAEEGEKEEKGEE
ncbi:30S ribosomal protein S6 [Candidatus Saccharibacteria bacterium]|nr:30S ribosomal protein S6 [Candidatus Saccharibacteria bacterium]